MQKIENEVQEKLPPISHDFFWNGAQLIQLQCSMQTSNPKYWDYHIQLFKTTCLMDLLLNYRSFNISVLVLYNYNLNNYVLYWALHSLALNFVPF